MTLIDAGPLLLDAAEVGHKFARLEALRAAGFPVPGFFCLSAAQFDRALSAVLPQVGPAPGDGPADAVAAWCANAREALAAHRPDADWAEELLAAFDRRIGHDALCAVRACVVPAADGTAEDSAADPFAGMSESRLYVPREGLLDAVAACWASAFTPHAVHYRQMRDTKPAAARVAVGVQHMVLGTRSFVAFTRDPRDGARRHVIAAAHGIGEGVVQERADVDHFFVDPLTDAVHAETTDKKRMVGPPARRGGPTRTLPVAPESATPPVLSDTRAREIGRLAARVEEFFEEPQDIEGAITDDGALHLVQARPLALGRPGAAAAGPRVAWGNHNITESFPGICGALTYSQARVFYQAGLTDFYRRMGVPATVLRAEAHRLPRMIGYINGRVYYRLDDWRALHSRMPVFDLIRSGWEEGMGITGEVRAGRRWPRTRVMASLPAVAWHALGHRRAMRKMLRWWDGLMDEVHAEPAGHRGPDELVAVYRRVWNEVGERWGVTLVNSVYGLLILRAGTALVRRWTGAGPELLVGLMTGGPENRSLTAVRAAIALAEHAGTEPRLRAALLTEDYGDGTEEDHLRAVWRQIELGAFGPQITRHFADYLRRYGDRALHDLKLDEPTPRQHPWMAVAIVRPFVRQGTTLASSRAEEARAAQAARDRLRTGCPNPIHRAVLRVLVALMRWCVRTREDARFCRTQLFGVSREVLWRLGAELAAAGLLDDALDVVDLTVEEVLGAFDGTLPGAQVRSLAALRRAEREGFADAPRLPVLMSTAADRPVARALRTVRPAGDDGGSAHTDAEKTLRGLGSSSGVVRARAKIVLDPSVDADSCRDRILVARETDPGWLFLMTAASGLVVERGTLLSHTAITGRLLGVPTAVAVHGATERIADGAWIELDAAAGTVTILDGPSDSPPDLAPGRP